jgi:hypothetical protein
MTNLFIFVKPKNHTIKKNINMENIIKIYKSTIPIINQLLFGNHKGLNFQLGKANLSAGFINTYHQNKIASNSKILEKYIEEQFLIVLGLLNQNEKQNIVSIVLSDDIFIEGLAVFNLNSKKSNGNNLIETTFYEIKSEIINYLVTGDMNSYILIYFKIYFEELFYFKFSDLNFITEKEYLMLINRFTNPRVVF